MYYSWQARWSQSFLPASSFHGFVFCRRHHPLSYPRSLALWQGLPSELERWEPVCATSSQISGDWVFQWEVVSPTHEWYSTHAIPYLEVTKPEPMGFWDMLSALGLGIFFPSLDLQCKYEVMKVGIGFGHAIWSWLRLFFFFWFMIDFYHK